MRKVALLVALVAAACGDGSSVVTEAGGTEPATATVTTAATTTRAATTVSLPATTSSIAATSSPATTSTIATTVTTSTTSPTTVRTESGVSTSSDCVLGWWDGTWHSIGDGAGEPPVAPGDALQLAHLGGVIAGEAVELFGYGPGDSPSPEWFLQTAPELMNGVGVSGEWDPIPHFVQITDTNTDVYRQQVAEFLSQRGYPGVPIELAQIVRTDLEGDGVNEVIVAAHHPGAPTYDRDVGVFSVVLLRRVIEEEVQTAILHFSVFAEEDIGFATSAEHALVAAVADLNGDGKMEIAINGSGYEWYWSEVFEYVNDDLGPVSRMLCGGGV